MKELSLDFLRRLFGVLSISLPALCWSGEFNGVASISNFYFYRGYSKTAGGPSVRGNLDYTFSSGIFAGSWFSRFDIGEKYAPNTTSFEFYPYLGVNYNLDADWRLEAMVSRYIFDGSIGGKYSDYNEYSAAVHFRDLATARIDVADNLYHRGKSAMHYQISARYPVLENVKVSGGVGFNKSVTVLEYDTLYWNFGITWF